MSVRVLIIDAHSERTVPLEQALIDAGFVVLDVVSETSDVIKRVQQLQPDAIIIDAESPTRDTLEGLALVGSRFPRPMIMLSEHADSELIRQAMQRGISAYVTENVSARVLRSLVDVAMLHFRSQRLLMAELDQRERELEDNQIIHRAKCLVMECEHLSEHESYHQMRKLAMQRGQKLVDLARALLAVTA